MIRECDYGLDIALTTNGSLLTRHAEKLACLDWTGLPLIWMQLKMKLFRTYQIQASHQMI